MRNACTHARTHAPSKPPSHAYTHLQATRPGKLPPPPPPLLARLQVCQQVGPCCLQEHGTARHGTPQHRTASGSISSLKACRRPSDTNQSPQQLQCLLPRAAFAPVPCTMHPGAPARTTTSTMTLGEQSNGMQRRHSCSVPANSCPPCLAQCQQQPILRHLLA